MYSSQHTGLGTFLPPLLPWTQLKMLQLSMQMRAELPPMLIWLLGLPLLLFACSVNLHPFKPGDFEKANAEVCKRGG